MPIYKMDGKKNGLQKYRVRINFTDSSGCLLYTSDAADEL